MEAQGPGRLRAAEIFERGLGLRRNLAASRAAGPLAWTAAGLLIGWTLVRLLGLDTFFPLVPLIAQTPYVALISPFAVVGALLLSRPRAAAAAAVASVALISVLIPRMVGDDPATGPGSPIVAMSSNMLAGNASVEALEDLVVEHGVEVFSVQEVTPEADRAIRASRIGELLPHAVTLPKPDTLGMALYSSRELTSPETDLGYAAGEPGIRATIEVEGTGPVDLFALHPAPPSTSIGTKVNRQYLSNVPSADPASAPKLLLGDFNATLDNSALRSLIGRGYYDVAERLGKGLTPTWSQGLIPPAATIDHAIVDERVGAVSYEVFDVPGSDHDAIVTELLLPPSASGS